MKQFDAGALKQIDSLIFIAYDMILFSSQIHDDNPCNQSIFPQFFKTVA